MSIPERHQRVSRLLGSGGPAVPDTLYIPAPEARPARRARLLLAPAVVAAGVALAVLVVVLTSAGDSGVRAYASISARPATEPTPASDGALLARSFQGVAYPDWSREFGWMAEGARTDTIDGRRAESVFYMHHGHRIAYTVIAGAPLEPPAGATTRRVRGVTLVQFRDGPRDVVMFERGGRTCVLEGEVLERRHPGEARGVARQRRRELLAVGPEHVAQSGGLRLVGRRGSRPRRRISRRVLLVVAVRP